MDRTRTLTYLNTNNSRCNLLDNNFKEAARRKIATVFTSRPTKFMPTTLPRKKKSTPEYFS